MSDTIILSRLNHIDQDVTDVRVKADDWEGTLTINALEELEHGGLEAAIEAKLAWFRTCWSKLKRIDKIAKY